MAVTTIKVNNISHQSQQYGLITDDIQDTTSKQIELSQCPIVPHGQSTVFEISNEAKFAVIGLVTAGALVANCPRDPQESNWHTVDLSKMVHSLRIDLQDSLGGVYTMTSSHDGFEVLHKAATSSREQTLA